MHLNREVVVIVDPVDGTRNALTGGKWYGPSLCGLIAGAPVAAVVVNLATGDRYEALTGTGVAHNGRTASATTAAQADEAIVATSGTTDAPTVSRPFYGAIAFALADVATGRLDAFVDYDDHHHRIWDYAAGIFMCTQAGAATADALGRDLSLPHTGHRSPVAAATEPLLDQLIIERARRLRDLHGGPPPSSLDARAS